MPAHSLSPSATRPVSPLETPSGLLDRASQEEHAGEIQQAMATFREAIATADSAQNRHIQAAALRRLAILYHHAGDSAEARSLAERSRDVALEAGDRLRAAEAVNVLAGVALEVGELDRATQLYQQAAELSQGESALMGRVEQNLGIIANVRGDWDAAKTHYRRSLAAFEAGQDERGTALAYHNLGMVSADQQEWAAAAGHLEQARAIAQRLGDLQLEGLARLNVAEVQIEVGRVEEAQAEVEGALGIFNQLGSERDKADAYRVLGTIYRRTGRTTLAEARLSDAVRLSASTGSALSEAEAARELALLYHDLGRNLDSVRSLTRAHRLFAKLTATRELLSVKNNVRSLENTYLSVVREWGQSIESADSYTYGHCERVATLGAVVAETIGVDDQTALAIQFGAYLHDLGKVKVPHEILNKPGRLTDEEMAVIQQHPVWGVELLADIDFPWDIVPIIRWHHERIDGTGYPDRLSGDEIPLSAQIICVVDVWDALTTRRSYRGAMSVDRALAIMQESQHWWRTEVYQAFLDTVPRN